MPMSEDLTPFTSTAGFAVEAVVNGETVDAIFDRNYREELRVEGNDPALTVQTADIPDGTAHGTKASVGFLQFKVKRREHDGTGVTVIRLKEGPTMGGAFYRITAANLDIDEGWPDERTHYLNCLDAGVTHIMLPASLDVSILLDAGAIERIEWSSAPIALWYYRIAGPIRDLDFAHDFNEPDPPEWEYYMSVPVGSTIGLSGRWQIHQVMVSFGLLARIVWP